MGLGRLTLHTDNVASTPRPLNVADVAEWTGALFSVEAFPITALLGDPHGEESGKHGAHGSDYKLFQKEDIWHWVIFTVVFFLLVIFDNVVLHRRKEAISFQRAMVYTAFWISCAGAFCVYIYFTRGTDDAFLWGTGYLLEWMLSVDNLFVFHLIFNIYGTPSHLKHKPLFWGIVGAIIFRMIFFCIEEVLMHSFTWMHILFGIFLIYTGIKTACTDDDDTDPRQNWLFVMISNMIPFVHGYDSKGAFFVKVPLDKKGNAILPDPIGEVEISEEGSGDKDEEDSKPQTIAIFSADSWYKPEKDTEDDGTKKWEWRATMLFLVVICLEVTDIIFAVDSVSAIVAQIPDLYLAYTACVFAMLGLRALFFVIDELIRLFSLLSYGVALILIFIGVKLMIKEWYHFPAWIVCCILVGTLTTCMIASLIYDKYKQTNEGEEQKKMTDPSPRW